VYCVVSSCRAHRTTHSVKSSIVTTAALRPDCVTLQGSIALWRTRLRPLLRGTDTTDAAATASSGSSSRTDSAAVKQNLFKGYVGLLHVCGTAARSDAAVKVVFAMTKDGLQLSPEVSSAYFNAKRAAHGDGEVKGAMQRYLRKQFEDLLLIECGASGSKKAPQSWMDQLPNIRIKF
jgi:hypothetical protein